MAPTLIILALLALGVIIVVFATRRKPDGPATRQADQDTAWNDPMTPAGSRPAVDDPLASAALADVPPPVDEDRRP